VLILRPRPVLVSAWPNRVLLDTVAMMAWPACVFVVQPDKRSNFHEAFFPALASGDLRLVNGRVTLGRSLRTNLHPIAVRTLSRLTGSKNHDPAGRSEESSDSDMSHRCARWLKIITADSAYNGLAKQVPYLFTSGAQRARIIATILNHAPHGKVERLIDIGSAVGVIPWLLQYDLPSLQDVVLIEPMRRFHAALEQLWQNGPRARNYTAIQTRAEEAEYSTADLIMLSHCLFLIPAEKRKATLQRAWDALNPGGVLLLNEIFTDASTANPGRPDIIHRDELFGMMPAVAQIFTRQTGWRTPQKLSSVTARTAGNTGVIFATKNGPGDRHVPLGASEPRT
jgi:phospholipid N-methyltransferase